MAGPGRPGRKRIEIDIDEVERLASRGLTQQQIADCLGISQKTIERRAKESVEFVEAIKRGQARGIATITNALFEQSLAGNVAAGIFYLKNRAFWTDRQQLLGDDEKPLAITIVRHGEEE